MSDQIHQEVLNLWAIFHFQVLAQIPFHKWLDFMSQIVTSFQHFYPDLATFLQKSKWCPHDQHPYSWNWQCFMKFLGLHEIHSFDDVLHDIILFERFYTLIFLMSHAVIFHHMWVTGGNCIICYVTNHCWGTINCYTRNLDKG